jgi:nitrogen fixation-related uncharacterized protein
VRGREIFFCAPEGQGRSGQGPAVATLIVIALCAAVVGLIVFAWAICAAAGTADDDMERALSEERHARNRASRPSYGKRRRTRTAPSPHPRARTGQNPTRLPDGLTDGSTRWLMCNQRP